MWEKLREEIAFQSPFEDYILPDIISGSTDRLDNNRFNPLSRITSFSECLYSFVKVRCSD